MKVAQRLWSSAGRTDTGKVRARNEDAFLDQPQQGLWVVADGMGGHQAGDLASRLIVESLAELPAGLDFEDRLDALRDCLHRLNRHLSLGLTLTGETPDLLVGSTVVALLAEGSRVACVWAGDSRCYLLRQGDLIQVTEDHTAVAVLLQQGLLSPEEAAHHPDRHAITRAIGVEPEVQPDYTVIDLLRGDALLLCSDGLYNTLPPGELAGTLQEILQGGDIHTLIAKANAAGGPDNITAVLIHNR